MVYDNIRRIFRRSGAATWTKRKSFIVNKWCATGSKLHKYLGLELASHDHAINNCITYTSLPVAACLLHVNISDLRYTLHTQRRMQTEVTGHDPPNLWHKMFNVSNIFWTVPDLQIHTSQPQNGISIGSTVFVQFTRVLKSPTCHPSWLRMGSSDVYSLLIHSSLCPCESVTPTASRSVSHCFLSRLLSPISDAILCAEDGFYVPWLLV